METLFLYNSDDKIELIFNIYDFNNDGQISKEDIKTVLNHIPLKPELKNLYEEQQKSKIELNNLLNRCFSLKSTFKLQDFIECITDVGSEIYLFLIIYLLEKKPFSTESIEQYKQTKLINSPQADLKFKKRESVYKMMVSPRLDSRLLSSDLLAHNDSMIKKFRSSSKNGVRADSDSKITSTIKESVEELSEKIHSQGFKTVYIQRKQKKDLKNLKNLSCHINYAPILKDLNLLSKPHRVRELEKQNYESYFFKLMKSGKMKRFYVKFLGRDMYRSFLKSV